MFSPVWHGCSRIGVGSQGLGGIELKVLRWVSVVVSDDIGGELLFIIVGLKAWSGG
jgi:hypothetical protein